MSEKSSEFSEMSGEATAEAVALIRRVEPRDHRSIKEWITVTARRLGWPYSRTKAVWYGDARRIDAREMDDLRAAARAKEDRKLRDEYEAIRAEIERLTARLALVGSHEAGGSLSEGRAAPDKMGRSAHG